MAYARFGAGSDVHVYAHVDGGYVCRRCRLCPGPDKRLSASSMLKHLTAHHNEDHLVPYALLATFGILSDLVPVPHRDPELARAIAVARLTGRKIKSFDVDVPEDVRDDCCRSTVVVGAKKVRRERDPDISLHTSGPHPAA